MELTLRGTADRYDDFGILPPPQMRIMTGYANILSGFRATTTKSFGRVSGIGARAYGQCQCISVPIQAPAHRMLYLPTRACMAFSICSLTASRVASGY